MTDTCREFAGTIHIQGVARDREAWLNWLRDLGDLIQNTCPNVDDVFVDMDYPVALASRRSPDVELGDRAVDLVRRVAEGLARAHMDEYAPADTGGAA